MTDYETIYRRYFETVYRYLLSFCHNASLAEELTQATFFIALEKIASFREDCAVESWLIGIARNRYFDHCRKQKHSAHANPLQEEREVGKLELSPEEAFFRTENVSRYHQLLHLLPEPYKEVFTLRVFGEMNFSAISALFLKSENWARVTYYRAKQKLLSQIREENEHD
jgi:RNA polymerase sigma-70 factor, ECF subfamily